MSDTAEDQKAEFTIKRFVLANLCERAAPVISSSDAVPALKNFLIKIAPGSITVTGTDLELSVVATSPSIAAEDTYTLALPARKLRDMLKEAPEGDITITVAGPVATLAAGSISWDLRLGDVAGYTEPPDVSGTELQAVDREPFLTALRAVKHAICKDGNRPPLMMVDITDNQVTTSDGSRFQRVKLAFPVDMKIPAAAVDHLMRMLSGVEAKQVHVAQHEQYLVFRMGAGTEVTFITKKTMARFPDMEKMILKPASQNGQMLKVSRQALMEAIRRVKINADDETSALALRLTTDKITVSSRDKSGNAAEQPVDAKWPHGERQLVINHVFLAEMLAAWPQAECRFWIGPDSGKRKSLLMLSDQTPDGGAATMVGIIGQLHAAVLGFK